MHPDKKVGFALGILLVGITGAFFFRNDVPAGDTGQLASADSLDAKIDQKTQRPYLPEREDENGIEVDDVSAADVIPTIPSGDNGDILIPNPIRLGDAYGVDIVPPIPSPENDLSGVDSAIAAGDSHGLVTPGGTDQTLSGNAGTKRAYKVHKVVAGDNLSEISEKYLGTSRRYREIYEANRDILKSPDDVRVGMKLKIPAARTDRKAAHALPAVGRPVASPGRKVPARTKSGSKANSPSFVRPVVSPVIPGRRTTQRSGKRFSQAAPPGVPRVAGLDPDADSPAVIASRPKGGADKSGSKNSSETRRD